MPTAQIQDLALRTVEVGEALQALQALTTLVVRRMSRAQLWASAGVKDPAYDDTWYVMDLVAPDVVSTMSEGTLDAVADHGVVPARSIRDVSLL
ncbi:hypothetical protein G3I60_07310 [Streptomyces sp. SID13666]|nr:hypothetical protein [Streptomyces sp. SID13666]